jgi:hypothetical protein
VPVKAWLQGQQFDLETLADLFREGEPKVAQEGSDYYITSASFDDLFQDGGLLNETALSLLRHANGIARAISSGYRPVTLVGRFTDESGGTTQVIAAASAEMRMKASAVAIVISGGVEQPAPPTPGPGYMQKVASNAAVREVLEILGKPVPELDWFDLYKVYEIIRDDVGRSAIIANGWATSGEVNVFTESANRPEVSGDGARHARLPGQPSGRSMNLGEGAELVKRVAVAWLDSL